MHMCVFVSVLYLGSRMVISGGLSKQWQTLFFGTPKSLQMVTVAMKLKYAYSLEEKLLPTETAY